MADTLSTGPHDTSQVKIQSGKDPGKDPVNVMLSYFKFSIWRRYTTSTLKRWNPAFDGRPTEPKVWAPSFKRSIFIRFMAEASAI